MFVFNSFCLPAYGVVLWQINKMNNKLCYETSQTPYNNALKKVFALPRYYSNHELTQQTNNFLVKYYNVFVQGRYYKRLVFINNSFIILCLPIMKNGYILSSISLYFFLIDNKKLIKYDLNLSKLELHGYRIMNLSV